MYCTLVSSPGAVGPVVPSLETTGVLFLTDTVVRQLRLSRTTVPGGSQLSSAGALSPELEEKLMLVLQWVISFLCPALLLTGALTSQNSLSSTLEREHLPDSGPLGPLQLIFVIDWPGGTGSPRIFTIAESSGLEGSKKVPALAFT